MKLETIFKHRLGTGLNGLFFSAPPHLRGIIGSMIGRGQTQSLAKVVPLSGGADWAGPGVDAEEEGKIFEVADDEEEKPLVLSDADVAKLKGLNEKLEKVDALILSENTKYPRDTDTIQDLEDKKKLIVSRINRIQLTRETLNKPSMLSVAIPKPTTKLIGPYADAYTDITFSTLNGIEPTTNIKKYIGGNNKAWENRVANDGRLLATACGFTKKHIFTEPFGQGMLKEGTAEKTPYDLFVSENSTEEAITNKGFFIECKKYTREVVIFDLWEEYKNKIQMYIYGVQTQAATLNVADRKEFLKIFQTEDKFDIAKINLNFYRDCPDYPGIIIGLNKTPFIKGKYKEDISPTYPEIYRTAYSKSRESPYKIPLQRKKGNLSFQSVSYGDDVVYEKGEYGLIFSIACSDGALFCNYFDIFKKHGIEYEEALNIFSASRTYYVSSGTDINSFKLPINEFYTVDLTVSKTFVETNPKKIADRQLKEIVDLLNKIYVGPDAYLIENKDLIYKALTQFPLKQADKKIITYLFKVKDLFTEDEKTAIREFLNAKIKPMYYRPFNNLIERLTAIIPRRK